MAATLSTNTIITLVDTRVNNGSINLPATSNIVNRTIYFKDLYGSFNTNYLQINTVGAETFEDGTSQKKFNDKYKNMLLHADQKNILEMVQIYMDLMLYLLYH